MDKAVFQRWGNGGLEVLTLLAFGWMCVFGGLAYAQETFPNDICSQAWKSAGKKCGYYKGEIKYYKQEIEQGPVIIVVSEQKIPENLEGVLISKADRVAFAFVRPNSEGENSFLLGPKLSTKVVEAFNGIDTIFFFQLKDGKSVNNLTVGVKVVDGPFQIPG